VCQDLYPAVSPPDRCRLDSDIATMPTPSDGYLVGFLTRDEIEVHLLTPADEPIPRRVDGPVVVPIVGIAFVAVRLVDVAVQWCR
jgi:hypothetical protein